MNIKFDAYKVIIMLVFFILLVFINMFKQQKNVDQLINLSIKGEVLHIIWESHNHNLPLFLIKTDNKVIELQHYKVNLTSEEIKAGDEFIKVAGSRKCLINMKEVDCIK